MRIPLLIVCFFLCFSIIWMTEMSRKEIRIDCGMLIGGYYPDVPRKVLEQCMKK